MTEREKYQFELDLPKKMLLRETKHFRIYYYPASLAEKELVNIAAQREKAYSDIAAYLSTDIDIIVDLYLFDDAHTKETETNHRGAGWAFDTVMVEIYTEDIKCHPYHELVHVFADTIYGPTLSFFSEGLAVFISESAYNHDFGDYVNYNTQEKVQQFHQDGELFSLREMFSLQIGERISNPRVSYPQAASLIKYLYILLGKNAFFELYQQLQCDYTDGGIANNIETFEKRCGILLEQVNQDWLNTVV